MKLFLQTGKAHRSQGILKFQTSIEIPGQKQGQTKKKSSFKNPAELSSSRNVQMLILKSLTGSLGSEIKIVMNFLVEVYFLTFSWHRYILKYHLKSLEEATGPTDNASRMKLKMHQSDEAE